MFGTIAGASRAADVVVTGVTYSHTFGRTVVSLYPKEDPILLGHLPLNTARLTKFTILWYIAAHDGRFPENKSSEPYGRIEIDPSPAT